MNKKEMYNGIWVKGTAVENAGRKKDAFRERENGEKTRLREERREEGRWRRKTEGEKEERERTTRRQD